MTALERPADALGERDWLASSPELRLQRCPKDSPAWGWEGEGEECQRLAGHDGPHYFDDPEVTVLWEEKGRR